jgi:hypothetical protein
MTTALYEILGTSEVTMQFCNEIFLQCTVNCGMLMWLVAAKCELDHAISLILSFGHH